MRLNRGKIVFQNIKYKMENNNLEPIIPESQPAEPEGVCQYINSYGIDNTLPNEEEGFLYGNNFVEEKTGEKEEKAEDGDKEEVICDACNKKFTTKHSLKRHHGRSPVCNQWINLINTNTNTNFVNINTCILDYIDDIKKKVTTKTVNDQLYCKFCSTEFSCVGNLNKHFKTATTCNHLAHNAFQEEISRNN